MSMEFIALPEEADSGTILELVAEYEHEPVLDFQVMDFVLKIKRRDGSTRTIDQRSNLDMTAGKTVRLEGDITVPSNKFDVIAKAETDFGPVSYITQTIGVDGDAIGCTKQDLNASDWAEQYYPQGNPTVIYGNGNREQSDPLDKLMQEDNTNYELQVDYGDVLAIGQTDYQNKEQRPPERPFDQQVADWKRGIMKSRVWCSNDSSWYWVTYGAKLTDLGGSPEDGKDGKDTSEMNTKYLAAGGAALVASIFLAREFSKK